MLFNSFEFLIFFPIVCIIFFILGKKKYQNIFLLIASYYFYMNWKPIYAVLILFSTVSTYLCGVLIEKYSGGGNSKTRRILLITSITLNLCILFTFKYFNFINECVFTLLTTFGLKWNVPNLDILLPVGISFYTFQAIGYLIDVSRGTIQAEKNFITYALFVSFFPQLVAGPIERAKSLLPQFHIDHSFNADDVSKGSKQMLWGFFMKLCVADVLSSYVDAIYNNVANHNGISLLLATFFFAFQIYCDFSGYSNIAIGTARIMGFHLMDNFRQPYFSTSIKDFWRRWHISLSSWFADYIYIPLGGNRVSFIRHLLNLMITFLISGLWHGANWTFAIWGIVHGFYMIVDTMFRRVFPHVFERNTLFKMVSTIFCFCMVCLAWIFFRANTITDAFSIINKILTNPGRPFYDIYVFVYGIASLAILLIKDAKDAYGMKIGFLHAKSFAVRFISFISLTAYIMLFGAMSADSFIYFQF